MVKTGPALEGGHGFNPPAWGLSRGTQSWRFCVVPSVSSSHIHRKLYRAQRQMDIVLLCGAAVKPRLHPRTAVIGSSRFERT